MKYKFLSFTVVFLLVSFMFSSCIKDDIKYLGDSGNTFVKFLEAPENQLFFSPFTDVKKIDLFSTRKDASNSKQLKTATTATLTSLPDMIQTYNDDNGTSFEELPDSLFTVLNSSYAKTSTGYTLTFAEGDFAKEFDINMDGSKWDVSHTYALAFGLSVTGEGIIPKSEQDTIMVFLSVKNKYDGKYTVTGSLTDIVVPTITGFYPWECEFHTSGPNSVQVYDPYYGAIYHAILSGADRSVYGAFGLEITFDPITNNVVSMTNVYGQPAPNTRAVLLDASTTYFWDETSKSMDLKYFMQQSSLVPVDPFIRTTFVEHFEYTGPR